MARPSKSGLEYFPLDVNCDDKIELIEAKHGLIGFGIVIKLYQKIYQNGYFIYATEEHVLILKKRINVDINVINDCINDCIKWGVFDGALFEKYNILTSKGVQKRYVEATKRRKEVEFIEDFLLLHDVKANYKEGVNVIIKSVNVDINRGLCNNDVTETPENVDSGTQSKVKYSIVKNKSSLSDKNPDEETQQNKYSENDSCYKLAEYLYSQILTHTPKRRKPNMQKWANDARLLLERDGRDKQDVLAVINFATSDEFWRGNIMSVSKLRLKFDQLFLKLPENSQPCDANTFKFKG